MRSDIFQNCPCTEHFPSPPYLTILNQQLVNSRAQGITEFVFLDTFGNKVGAYSTDTRKTRALHRKKWNLHHTYSEQPQNYINRKSIAHEDRYPLRKSSSEKEKYSKYLKNCPQQTTFTCPAHPRYKMFTMNRSDSQRTTGYRYTCRHCQVSGNFSHKPTSQPYRCRQKRHFPSTYHSHKYPLIWGQQWIPLHKRLTRMNFCRMEQRRKILIRITGIRVRMKHEPRT